MVDTVPSYRRPRRRQEKRRTTLKRNSVSLDPGRTLARMALLLATALLLLAAAGLGGRIALAATQTLTVDSTTDIADGTTNCPGTPCTLRKAIAVANSDTGDTINVSPGTYTLTTDAELQIRSAMNIVGSDPRTTIIDGHRDTLNTTGTRIFNILNVTIDVGISNLTLQKALSDNNGGAVFNQSAGTVTLTNDAIVANRSLSSGGTNGAGIFNRTVSHLNINRTLLADNRPLPGSDGGALGSGGAIFNDFGGTMTVTNSTLTNNVANRGGAIFNGGEVTLLNDTITGNAAGVDANSGVGLGGGLADQVEHYSLQNTIVAKNTNGDCHVFSGSNNFTTQGHNIDGDNTCSLNAAMGDQPTTDPQLQALALNSPGQTSTMAIGTGSPALDQGDNSGAPATDQRGVTRPQNTTVDIGAYEFVPAAPASPTPTAIPALPQAGRSTPSGNSTGAVWVALASLAFLGAAGAALVLSRRGREQHSL
jgi:hypothetical protein